jgi:hypothetical protein
VAESFQGVKGIKLSFEGKAKLGIGGGAGVGVGVAGFMGIEFNLQEPYDLSLAADVSVTRGAGASLNFGCLSSGPVSEGNTFVNRLGLGIGPLSVKAHLLI